MVFLAHFQSTKLLNCSPTFTYDGHLSNFSLWVRVQSLDVRWQQKFRPETAHNPALLWVRPAGSLKRDLPEMLRACANQHFALASRVVSVTWQRNFGNTARFGWPRPLSRVWGAYKSLSPKCRCFSAFKVLSYLCKSIFLSSLPLCSTGSKSHSNCNLLLQWKVN